jgi:3-deoxy-D-manno-octulosonic-acid transferase
MYIIYNILQLLFIAVFFPFIILYGCSKEKYRNRIPSRLGAGLGQNLDALPAKPLTIWLHALSVGEVTSALPLIQGLRTRFPESRIIVSVTTQGGREVADKVLLPLVDRVINGPLDILPVVYYFLRKIRPDIYILVETDFWPNILYALQRNRVPSVLVNGRVSDSSMAGYRRMGLFFRPMFNIFSLLFMQTEHDKENMARLLGHSHNLHAFGNLKYDTVLLASASDRAGVKELFLPSGKIFFIAGSTHAGEEQPLLRCYSRLKTIYPQLHFILAPRDNNRAGEIQTLAARYGLTCTRRTSYSFETTDIFLVDTIGELLDFYAVSSVGFVGGSLVNKGGHNPIEPAAMGIPVLFGPDMSDFREIAQALIDAGGAYRVSGEESLEKVLTTLLNEPELRKKKGKAAQQCVLNQCGVVEKHLQCIKEIM